MKPDPYNPDETVEDWTRPTRHTIDGFLATTGSSEQNDANDVRAVSTAVLTIPDPEADIRRGDVIDDGERRWHVEGFTANDTNPFTGWQPTKVAQLTAWNTTGGDDG